MVVLNTAILVAITIGLTEVIKRLGANDRFIPLIAVIVGILVSYFSALNGSIGIGEIILSGVVNGLTAVGLYSGVTNTLKSKI